MVSPSSPSLHFSLLPIISFHIVSGMLDLEQLCVWKGFNVVLISNLSEKIANGFEGREYSYSLISIDRFLIVYRRYLQMSECCLPANPFTSSRGTSPMAFCAEKFVFESTFM